MGTIVMKRTIRKYVAELFKAMDVCVRATLHSCACMVSMALIATKVLHTGSERYVCQCQNVRWLSFSCSAAVHKALGTY